MKPKKERKNDDYDTYRFILYSIKKLYMVTNTKDTYTPNEIIDKSKSDDHVGHVENDECALKEDVIMANIMKWKCVGRP